MPDDTPFKPGDKVRHKNAATLPNVFEVLGVQDLYVWLSNTNNENPPYTGFARVYEKVTPFFEPGKSYTRQGRDYEGNFGERFEVTVVERHGNGKAVAFGRLVSNAADRWITQGEYEFINRGWEEAK